MTQKKSTPLDLQSDQILKIVAKSVSEKDGNEGEPPSPTPDDLSNPDWWNFLGNFNAKEVFNELHKQWQKSGKEAIDTHIKFTEQDRKDLIKLNPDSTSDEIRAIAEKQIPAVETPNKKTRNYFVLIGAFSQSFLMPSITERIENIHKIWSIAKETNPQLKHPLAPIVRAWLQEQTAKRIDAEYDHKHPVAVLKHPMGSIREINFIDSDSATLREFATPERITQVKDLQQTFDFAKAVPSVLPPVMPLEIAPYGLPPQTRKGTVHHTLRIFIESLMALDPEETTRLIRFTLGDLISYLYPDGKFNRTNQLEYILDALYMLSIHATVPYETESGGIGRWKPVIARNVLNESSKNEDMVYLDVRLPPDSKQGMLVEKQIMRQLGKESAPKFNAYLTACWLWDKYGTQGSGLIDPTRPIDNRDYDGFLIDTHGKKIYDSRGKPIKSPYKPQAIQRLPREDNPARERYPILSFDDLVLSCFPSGLDPKRKKRAWERAKAHWEELEKRKIIRIERFPNGWRIMPSESHLAAYRAMKNAQNKR